MNKYKIVYITHFKDGTYISVTSDKNLEFEEAINKANRMKTIKNKLYMPAAIKFRKAPQKGAFFISGLRLF